MPSIKIKEWVDAEYENGRQTAISNSELTLLAEKYSGGKLKK